MFYSGNTLEDALLKAEEDTGRKRDELIYTVTDNKRNFFRNSEISIEVNGFKEYGMLEVVNGQIRFIKGDILPVLEPGPNINISVNDNMIFVPTKINPDDIVKITAKNVPAERHAKVTISDDLLEAFLDVVYSSERNYIVADGEASHHLKVEARLLSEKFPDKYSRQELLDILKENGIKYGFILANIEKAVDGGKYLAAAGNKCTPPQDDYIKYFFNIEPEKKPLETEGRIDYYNIGEIEYINAGSLLATKYDGKDGKPGCDVHGNIIFPEKKKKIKLLKGPGTRFSDDKASVISVIDGMPSIKNGAACVYSAYIVNDNVGIKTGNVDFDGDVVIKGNVLEGMKIRSGNNINIYGDAINSEITSAGNIKIARNVICCSIKAGENQLNESEAIKFIKIYGDFLIKICHWYNNSIQSASTFYKENPGLIFKMILESRFGSFKENIENANNFFSKNVLKEDIQKLWDRLSNIFKLIESGKMVSIDVLISTLKIINEFVETYSILLAPADIIVQYCQNSTLNATNSVEIKGKGCYNTIITAENTVKLSGLPGVFRGGRITAQKSIYVGEAGSTAGVATILKTSRDGIIEAKIAYPNTVIGVDELIYKLENPVKNLKAYINKGELVVEKLKL